MKPYLDPRKGHLSVKIVNFEKDPATTKAAGTITAAIQVKDLVTGESKTAKVGEKDNITKLSTLTETKTAINTAISNSTIGDIVKACSGQEAVIKANVLALAESKINNPGIKVSYKTWEFKPISESESGSRAKENGTLKFVLLLTAESGRTASCNEVSATLDAGDEAKYVSLEDATKAFTLAVADKDATTNPSKDAWANLKTVLASADNTENAIKTAIETALNTETAKFEGYTCTWKETEDKKAMISYTPADSANNGKLSFTLTVTLTGAVGTDQPATKDIVVTDAPVLEKADKYQSEAELIKAIKAVTEIEVNAAPTDQSGAVSAVNTELLKLKKTGALTDISTIASAITEGEDGVKTAFTAATDSAPAKVERVKITVGEEEFTQDFTFKVAAASS